MSAYVDGMLEGDQLRRMAMHLEQCPSCRDEFDSLVQVRGMLRKMSTPSAPPSSEFWADAYRSARLAGEPRAAHRPVAWRGALSRFAAVAGFAAVVAVGIVSINITGSHLLAVPASAPAAAAVVDVGELVQAHANFAASQPLTDRARVTMVTSEIASQNSDGAPTSTDVADTSATEPAVNAAIGMD